MIRPGGRPSPLIRPESRAHAPRRTWSPGRKFATGVAVLTAGADHDVRGATVSAFTYICREPPLVSVCLNHGSALLALLIRRGTFGVSVLSRDQAGVARRFADPGRWPGLGQFENVAWIPGPDGKVPLLLGAVSWLDCRYLRHEPIGDHEFVLAEVQSATDTDAPPLLYFDGDLYPGAIHLEGSHEQPHSQGS